MKNRTVISIISGLLILIVGCTTELLQKEDGESTSLTSLIKYNLSISYAPILYQIANLSLTVKNTGENTAWNVSLNIVLPDGFELIDGNLSWNGKLAGNEIMQLNISIKAIKTGNWTIKSSGGYIYITVGEKESFILDKGFVEPCKEIVVHGKLFKCASADKPNSYGPTKEG